MLTYAAIPDVKYGFSTVTPPPPPPPPPDNSSAHRQAPPRASTTPGLASLPAPRARGASGRGRVTLRAGGRTARSKGPCCLPRARPSLRPPPAPGLRSSQRRNHSRLALKDQGKAGEIRDTMNGKHPGTRSRLPVKGALAAGQLSPLACEGAQPAWRTRLPQRRRPAGGRQSGTRPPRWGRPGSGAGGGHWAGARAGRGAQGREGGTGASGAGGESTPGPVRLRVRPVGRGRALRSPPAASPVFSYNPHTDN